MKTPAMLPNTPPLPPAKDVPPITTAAIESTSYPFPIQLSETPSHPAKKIPDKAAMNPDIA